ncbi:MAG: AAA family ATPase [Betaproteobacteria bacterium]|nr:AAA family ATPase [Betaproteobacteria bacterium]
MSRSTKPTTGTAFSTDGGGRTSAKIRFISAGAGSGKTHRLTQILGEEPAFEPGAPSRVIATTSTRKAARSCGSAFAPT